MEQAIIVSKRNVQGRETYRYAGTLLARGPNWLRLEAFFDRQDLDLGFAIFKRGDRFVESYYNDRWYNVFAVYDRDEGWLRGWYCNICRPARFGQGVVSFDDLALDLWVPPAGEALLLDEEEFAALALPAAEQEQAWRAVDRLRQLARRGQMPA